MSSVENFTYGWYWAHHMTQGALILVWLQKVPYLAPLHPEILAGALFLAHLYEVQGELL